MANEPIWTMVVTFTDDTQMMIESTWRQMWVNIQELEPNKQIQTVKVKP